jgi:hypothetical protein
MVICLSTILAANCSGAAEQFEIDSGGEPGLAIPAQPEAPVEPAPPASVGEQAVIYRASGSDNLTAVRRADRLIIKNAEIKLLVEDSDIAIDRTTQIINDVGGYIISSRVWYEEWGDNLFKYSTITIGVPSDQFERTLRRLRDVGIRVLDENAIGEDVTDEFVDLQSQLDNLEATRDRIRGFLDQAENVEEALNVNEELSKVEGQIEEIQGRINYLSDRAAYSTITITIEPELKVLPTPTPRPTSTPTPWNASETYGRAKLALTNTYKSLFNIAIWLVVVVLPVIGPFAVIGWLLWKYSKRKVTQEEDEEPDND